MSIVRQLSALYLRGALANVTMANMSAEERYEAERVTLEIAKSQEIQQHRHRVMKKYRDTIKADYQARDSAEQEFLIAVWRGVVSLLYHHNYTYQCRACGSTTYKTKRLKPTPIDRIGVKCQNCQQVQIVNAGATDLVVGSFVQFDDFQESYIHLPDGADLPESISPVDPIMGDKKYEDPYSIINDPEQRKKFFGEFIWNYLRQHLNENKRVAITRTEVITGPADMVVPKEIISLCTKMNVDHEYSIEHSTIDSHVINVCGHLAPPEFTANLMCIINSARRYKVDVVLEPTYILIKRSHCYPRTATITISEHVLMMDGNYHDEETSNSIIQQVSHKTIGDERVIAPSHTIEIERTDEMNAVWRSLSDDARSVMEIYSQQGPAYESFTQKFGANTKISIKLIAEHLGITTKAVSACREQIKLNCLAHDLVPA